MTDTETTEDNETEKRPHPARGSEFGLGVTLLAIVGLLTIVIGGSVLIQNGLADDDEPRDRIIRIFEPAPDEPERVCYEEVVPRGGGLFGDLEADDDFDAEAGFADARGNRVVIVCEDW